MILLKDMKRGLYVNADKYWRAHQKDRISIAGLDLQVGTRLRGTATVDGKMRKFYLMVLSLDPSVIAYWLEGEFAIYLSLIHI